MQCSRRHWAIGTLAVAMAQCLEWGGLLTGRFWADYGKTGHSQDAALYAVFRLASLPDSTHRVDEVKLLT